MLEAHSLVVLLMTTSFDDSAFIFGADPGQHLCPTASIAVATHGYFLSFVFCY